MAFVVGSSASNLPKPLHYSLATLLFADAELGSITPPLSPAYFRPFLWLKPMWNSFTESVKANLTTLADSTSRMYSRLSAYPEEVTCSRAGCGHVIPVPVSTFNWRCPHGHMTAPERAACTTPGCGAPRGNHTPTIVCPACSEVVIVPTTTFERNLREGARAAPDAVSHAANTAVKEVKSLAKPPSTFPCYFCQSKLTVPTGPWVCALNGCGCENTSAATQCASCAADRYALGVLCGVCGRPTPVPANKITVELSSAVSTAIAGSVRTMNYVTNTPYVQCPTCTAPHYPSQEDLRALGADDEIVAAASPAGAHSPAPGAAGASAGAAAAAGATPAGSAPAGTAPAGAAPASSAPAGSAPAPASVSSVSCGCSNCLSRYSFGLSDVTLRTKPSAKEQGKLNYAPVRTALFFPCLMSHPSPRHSPSRLTTHPRLSRCCRGCRQRSCRSRGPQ